MFPEDDQVAWEMLLHWQSRGFASRQFINEHGGDLDQLVLCWVLGDKYNIKGFQNTIMHQMLMAPSFMAVKLTTVKLTFELTPQKSPLRALMAEEVDLLMHRGAWVPDDEWEHGRLQELDGVAGFTTELMYALDRKEASAVLGSSEYDESAGPQQRFLVV